MQRDQWRLGLLAREAFYNVFGVGSRMLVILGLAMLAGSGASVYHALEAQELHQEVQDLAAEGRNVLVFSRLAADEPAYIERASCEGLVQQRGVTHAGMLDYAGEVDVIPVGTQLPSQRASATLFPQLSHADVLVGHNLSDRSSQPFTVQVGEQLVAAVPTEVRPAGLAVGSSITLPPRPTDVAVERCVVMLDPFSDAGVAASTMASQLKVVGNLVSSDELLTATNDPITEYLERPSRWLPLLLGLFGGVVTAVVMRLRASEVATYRMSGSSPVSLMTLLGMEALFIAGVAALAATGAAVVLAPRFLDPVVPLLWGLVLAGAWAIVAVAGVIDLTVRQPNDLAKDR